MILLEAALPGKLRLGPVLKAAAVAGQSGAKAASARLLEDVVSVLLGIRPETNER